MHQYVTPPTGEARIPFFRFHFLEYHRLIDYYRTLFGAENLLVLPYELLLTRPEAFLGRIGEFAGVPAIKVKPRQVNTSPSALALSVKRHANQWFVRDALNPSPPLAFDGSNEVFMRACRKVDATAPAALREGYERRWRRFAEQEVGTRYANSNTLTAELIGLDLRAFGYLCGKG